MSKRTEQLKKHIGLLKQNLEDIITEHDLYTFESEQDVQDWLHSFPIETLSDSISHDNKASSTPSQKPSLSMLVKKSELRKRYNKEKDDLEIAVIEYNIAHIDSILKQIKSLL